MEYSKNEIRELVNLINDDVLKLDRYTNLFIPDAKSGVVEIVIANEAVKCLDAHLKCIKAHCIDTDDYDLSVNIESKVTDVWKRYSEKVTDESEINKLGVIPGRSYFTSIKDTMLDWEDWLDEYETEHPKQQTSTNTPEVSQVSHDKTMGQVGQDQASLFNKESLMMLFIQAFMSKDYKIEDTSTESVQLSRFDVLCKRLELLLSNGEKSINTNQRIGSIAYMIYCSPYANPDFRKPKRKNARGCFAKLIKSFFDIVGKDCPSDTRPNKYPPTQIIIDYFGDVLKWDNPLLK